MEVFRQEYTGVGCHTLLQGGLPDPGTKPVSLKSPALAGGFFSTSTTREAPDSSGVEVEMNDWMNAEEWVLVQERRWV